MLASKDVKSQDAAGMRGYFGAPWWPGSTDSVVFGQRVDLASQQ